MDLLDGIRYQPQKAPVRRFPPDFPFTLPKLAVCDLSNFQGLSTQISKAVLTQAILFYFKEVFTQYTILLIAVARKLASKQRHLIK